MKVRPAHRSSMPPRFARVLALAACLLAFAVHTTAVAQSAAPTPRWLWVDSGDEQAKTAHVRKAFTVKPGLLKAVMMAACDGRMTVYVNGVKAAEVRGFRTTSNADLTALIKPGPNVIAVEAERTERHAAFSLLIELADDEGKPQYLTTDSTWKAASNAPDGWQKLTLDDTDWQFAASLGQIGSIEAERWGNPYNEKWSFDAYNSWKLASNTTQATDPKTIAAPPGFTVDLLRSAKPGEDSWVAMAFDPQGRITVAKEKRGLLRFTLGDGGAISKVEVIEDSLLECRGLLYAYDSLYVNANNSKGFYRLRDRDNSGRYEPNEKELLLQTGGGVGHGRNHVVLGPDGAIYLVHGDAVELTDRIAPDSPYKNYAVDRLVRNPWDKQWSGGAVSAPNGHILRTDKDGKTFTLIAGGLRNPLGLAFNEAGQMFTYEADLEWDVGLPWYRPTRVLHIVSGGEYGWRRGTANWPEHYRDSLPAVCDIGLGSPTAVEFAALTNYPGKWRDALYICEWAYGRIIAVHLSPDGATYTGRWENFVQGRPLNVTDLVTGPDGAMYFTTGGRGTQSGLYRVRWTGTDEQAAALNREATEARDEAALFEAEAARTVRAFNEAAHRKLEGDKAKRAIDEAFSGLRSEDRWIRFAARVALEHQDVSLWQLDVYTEKNRTAALTGLMALVRVGDDQARLNAIAQINQMNLGAMSETEQLLALRTYALAFRRLSQVPTTVAHSVRGKLDTMYPAKSRHVNHDLCELLVALQSPQFVEKTLDLLKTTDRPDDVAMYLTHLRYVKKGWSLAQLAEFFRQLNRAHELHTSRYYQRTLKAIRAEMTAGMPDEAKQRLAGLIVEPQQRASTVSSLVTEKPAFVRDWKMADLAESLGEASRGRSFAAGRKAFMAAQCIRCHRMGAEGPPAEVGPDLTGVGFRLDRRTLLESILEPSQVVGEKYQQVTLTLADGGKLTGVIESEAAGRVVIRTDAMTGETKTIAADDIVKRTLSKLSPMPANLADVLTREQILDLLAYLESGGNPKAGNFAEK